MLNTLLDWGSEVLRAASRDHFKITLTSSHLLRPPVGCFRFTSSTFFTLPASLPTQALPSSSSVMHLCQSSLSVFKFADLAGIGALHKCQWT